MPHRIKIEPDHGEPIELENRKPLTPKQRAEMFAAHKGICCLCGDKILDPNKWIDEHFIPVAIGRVTGSVNAMENRGPVHIECAKEKTTKDRKDIAKAKRLANETGQNRKKKKIQSRGFQTNRSSPYRKKMDGTVVRRNGDN